MRKYIFYFALFLVVFAENAEGQPDTKTEIDVVSYMQSTGYYYDGARHMPNANDISMYENTGNGNKIVSTDRYEEVTLSNENDSLCTNEGFKVYIIARDGDTFKTEGDTIGSSPRTLPISG
jgi:hypothetical protein